MDLFGRITDGEFVQAVRSGEFAKVKSLLGDGADVNSADDGNASGLSTAIEKARRGMLILEGGDGCRDRAVATPDITKDIASGALSEPAQLFRYRHPPIADDPKDFLPEDIMWPDLSASSKLSALQWATLLGHTEIVNLLLNSRARIRHTVDCRYYPLHLAARRGHHPVIFLLLASGADINCYATSGRTPLDLAAEARLLQTCQLLINNGARLSSRTVNCETPLFAACENGDAALVQLFIQLGSKTNVRGGPRQQSLLHACAAGRYDPIDQVAHIGVLKILLEHGCDQDELDDKKTAAQIAESKGFTDVARFLDEWRIQHPSNPKRKKKKSERLEMKI